MFLNCDKIIEIDLSHCNSNNTFSCESTFEKCYSLKKINFGLLDFYAAKSFKKMFCECKELKELDVSKFNTQNSISFESMFEGCIKLQNLDISKFNSSKCKCISKMFKNCQNITGIDMVNWNLCNLEDTPLFFTLKNMELNNCFLDVKILK
jgi:surface protein